MFNIKRESDSRNVKTDVLGQDGDNFNVKRDPFEIDPVKNKVEPELGMEFLVEDEDEVEQEVEEEYEEEPDMFNTDHEKGGSFPEEPQKSYAEIQQEKAYFLSQLKRLEKKGNVTSRRFSMEHTLDEIRNEVIRIKNEIAIDNSLDYCRQGLMFFVSTIEMAEGKYNMGAELGGWSQNVMGCIDTYDEVFEELYIKYASSMSMLPEIKLISMLAGSAFMFSLNKKMNIGAPAPRQRSMDGPSVDTDDLMARLNEMDLGDDMSEISDVSGDSIVIKEEEIKSIPIKKTRGRPKKN
jgi:hypothetical protein